MFSHNLYVINIVCVVGSGTTTYDDYNYNRMYDSTSTVTIIIIIMIITI